jgi:hypothetical protein
MDDALSTGLDDDRIAAAARRIIRQYRLQEGASAGDTTATAVPLRTPDLPGMRLALDDMSQAIEHFHRLLERREAVFLAALERVERNVAATAGRIDALSEEVARLASQPAIDLDGVKEDSRAATAEILKEFGNMMALGRAMLDEAALVRIRAVSDVSEDGGHS